MNGERVSVFAMQNKFVIKFFIIKYKEVGMSSFLESLVFNKMCSNTPQMKIFSLYFICVRPDLALGHDLNM